MSTNQSTNQNLTPTTRTQYFTPDLHRRRRQGLSDLAIEATKLLCEDYMGPKGAKRLSQNAFNVLQAAVRAIEGPTNFFSQGEGDAFSFWNQSTEEGDTIITIINNPTDPDYVPPEPGEPPPGGDPPGGPGGPGPATSGTFMLRTDFRGTVSGGSGSSHTVTLIDFQRSVDAQTGIDLSAPEEVTATVPQIADGEEIPAGTYVPVVTRNMTVQVSEGIAVPTQTTWTFQVPVWM